MDSVMGCKGSKAALVVLTERLTRYPVIIPGCLITPWKAWSGRWTAWSAAWAQNSGKPDKVPCTIG